jgi:8-oxo-dGTP pyrophosphatase MutT (NUDIX family)
MNKIKSKNNKKTPRRELSAGGLVFKRAPKGVSFAMIKDSYGKWTFPKGHIEPREAVEEAAARETIEELGLEEIRLLEPLGKIEIWFKDAHVHKGRIIHKDIFFFLFSAPPWAKLCPQAVEVQAVKWIPADQVLKKSFYEDMVPIIKQALELINKKYL